MGIVIMSLGFQEKTIYILNYTFGNFEIIFDLTRVCWVRLDLLTIKLKENIIYLWLEYFGDFEKKTIFIYAFWILLLEILKLFLIWQESWVRFILSSIKLKNIRIYYLFVIRISLGCFWKTFIFIYIHFEIYSWKF